MRRRRIRKHTPQRTCVACRRVRAKRELVRLVCIPEGGVEVDTTGKRVGRGAYLCRNQECWQVGLKSGQLERSLRTTLTQENQEQLTRYGKDFIKE